jgi:hypothetical protein
MDLRWGCGVWMERCPGEECEGGCVSVLLCCCVAVLLCFGCVGPFAGGGWSFLKVVGDVVLGEDLVGLLVGSLGFDLYCRGNFFVSLRGAGVQVCRHCDVDQHVCRHVYAVGLNGSKCQVEIYLDLLVVLCRCTPAMEAIQ